ncbi:hypothetical protein I6A60_31880 [Frankia sp. AgB1.9]|uniref:hypothetical protein n=1 Tax=unclassified Frankia TaxID=2632575 RepID=UPI0019318CED|nr:MULTISPECIES: hypothetical protein [unclassified Frankia]MBL7490140.1 hypothetical protein [Frankia sp. AgW1.1]MBL7552427.1 hypothetical protein [Frankia sp. AgB1.9]MBL7622696.1 hypothetical protein [Frankia sp. AgB1.8]
MTSENEAGNDSPVVDAAARPVGGSGPEAGTREAAGPPATTQPPAAGARPRLRPRDLDWDNEPVHGLDPEDSRSGRADNLARLLDDVPPHHVDH